jgi:RecA-family ATPase
MSDDDPRLPPIEIPQMQSFEDFERETERELHAPKPNGKGNGKGHSEDGEIVRPNFRTLAEFCAEFRPVSYAVAGLMREGSLYTLTGRTGEGKTAFLVILALAIAAGEGLKLIGRKVKQGRVAFCTAENPDDLRMRLMIACYIFNIDPAIIDRDMLISDNRVAPENIVGWIKKRREAFTLIVVDTWQAYFDGRDPNNNAEAVSFTRRFRPLATGDGQPIVLIAAHPPKQAGNDNLVPYGGGGTLNEVDGNFTMRSTKTASIAFTGWAKSAACRSTLSIFALIEWKARMSSRSKNVGSRCPSCSLSTKRRWTRAPTHSPRAT